MGDGSLSQEEIDALLMGTDDMSGGGGDPFAGLGGSSGGSGNSSDLSPSEVDILTDAFNDAMKVAGGQLPAMLDGKSITISCTGMDEAQVTSVPGQIQPNSIVVNTTMGSAKTAYVFPVDLARRVAMIMMGESAEPSELNDAHLSTLTELINTVGSSLSNSLSSRFNDNLAPSAPEPRKYNTPDDAPQFGDSKVLRISYNVTIQDQPTAKLVQYVDYNAMARWGKSQTGGDDSAAQNASFDLDFGTPASPASAQQGVPINPVNFPSLQQSASGSALPPNLDLLLDVQMVLTVELGRTKKYVKEILSLGEGSIIELDKLAGEPVDLLVNGKLIAKGEVVVIDENFGVRVTDIVGPAERLARMSS